MRSLTTAVLIGVFACGGSKPTPKPVDNTTTTTPLPPHPPEPLPAAPPSGKSEVRMKFVDATNSIVLEGVIVDKAIKEAVIGATVVVTGAALVGEQIQITDEKGIFAMGSLPPGKYEVTVYYSNATTKGAFEIKQGKRTKIEIDLDTKETGPGEVGEVVQIDAAPEPVYKTAYEALQHGALAQTIKLGEAELAKSPSSKLHAMLAIARYGVALEGTRYDLLAFGGNKKTSKDVTKGLVALSAELEKAQAHLAAAAKDAKFSLELCVACMPLDGNMQLVPTGLFDIERDKQGQELPEGDKRRRPTYRFDIGDIAWARAMLSYQQALVSLASAYDWSWMDRFMDSEKEAKIPKKLTIKLVDAKTVVKAREQLFAGLAASDEARNAYVAETDDDREWVPSPRQKNYAAPMAVDAPLYRTWEDVVLDVRSLVAGETGISFQALWELAEEKDAPPGFIDLGAMLTKPKDIVIDIEAIDRIEREKNPAKRATLVVGWIKGLIGNGFRMQMKPSRLTDRLLQLRKDMSANEAMFEDKMKLLFWLN